MRRIFNHFIKLCITFSLAGYKVSDFISIVPVLNTSLHQKPREATKTVRNKYAHKIFHEVSKVPLLTNEKLLDYQD